MERNELNRRRFLQGVGAAGLMAVGGASLASCSSDDNSTSSGGEGDGNSTSGFEMPTYKPVNAVTPDLPGDGDIIPDAFLKYPGAKVPAIESPGDGSTVVATTPWIGAPPPAVDQNPYWQELNKRLGVTLEFESAPAADYMAKIQTMIAGGDLPDFMQFPDETQRLPEILEAEFADITDYVAGDAIQDYPYLANLPTYCWEQSVFNGRLYGIKRPLFPYGNIMMANRGTLADMGLSVDEVTDAASFANLCREVTDPSANRWALMNPIWNSFFISEMAGKPDSEWGHWYEDGGKFVFARETDEYRQALDLVIQLWRDGVFHPDSLALTGGEEIQQFKAGRSVFDYRGGNQWALRDRDIRTDSPDSGLTAVLPVAFDGGGLGAKAIGPGTYRLTAIKKTDDADRIRMQLRILNWLAAPIGTEDYEFRRFGIEGEHFNFDQNGDPVLTEQGKTETKVPTVYVMAYPNVTYAPGSPSQVIEDWQGYVETIAPTGVRSASLGLWSDTFNTQQTALMTQLDDAIKDIFRNDGSLADFDAAMDAWRQGGGDTIRAEYEAAFNGRESQ